MNPLLRNILAVVLGLVAGNLVNMALINLSGSIIPPPAGADVTTFDGLKKSLHLFEPRHFIMPFLAHAAGTFIGAFLAALIAVNHKMRFAYGIGLFFLLAGIANVFLLPSPVWFTVVDIVFAYIPMAWLGGKLALFINKPIDATSREYESEKANTI